MQPQHSALLKKSQGAAVENSREHRYDGKAGLWRGLGDVLFMGLFSNDLTFPHVFFSGKKMF